MNYEESPNPYLYSSCKKSDQGTIIGVNQLFSTFFGYSKEEVTGKKLGLILPKIYVTIHEKYMQSFVENFYMNIRVDIPTESDYTQIE